MATKEDRYTELLKALGIWEDAFSGAVHDLAVLEREQSRTRKAWKATAEGNEAPSTLDEHYQVILQQGREIAKLREVLGLTPKALRRIRGEFAQEKRGQGDAQPTVLEIVRARQRKQA